MTIKRIGLGGVVVMLCLMAVAAKGPTGFAATGHADKLFTDKNYKEAAQAYDKLLEQIEPAADEAHHARRRVIVCRTRLGEFDAALAAAEQYVQQCRGTPFEARAQRLAGNLYLRMPHWGTRAGGTFHRGQWKQGIRVDSSRHDRGLAIEHLQKARQLYAKYDQGGELPKELRDGWRDERIECVFDLVRAHASFGIYENGAQYWHTYWAQRDDTLAQTAGEDDFDEGHSYQQWHRKRPIGLRVDDDGEPIFATVPENDGPNLTSDQQILYLLKHIRDLDDTADKRHAARSVLRQAMLSRSRFGMDRALQYANQYYDEGRRPLQDELTTINPWQLQDDQAIVLAGGRVRVAKLPRAWDVIALLQRVVTEYPDSPVADEAAYAIGLYHQTRQQYTTAIARYESLIERSPKGEWSDVARSQIGRIKQPQVRINNTGVQLPGGDTKLSISYRNTGRVWFTARRIDHEKLMRKIHATNIDPDKGLREFHLLAQWHRAFVNGYHENNWEQVLAAEFLGEEAARWSATVKNDQSHRYAQTTLDAPLDDSGAYLVQAYLSEPPAADADKQGVAAMQLGNSRAVVALNDLAIVEKKVKSGNLYYICDAVSGAPVAGAEIQVLEVWTTWNKTRRRSIHHKRVVSLKTDAQGMAVHQDDTQPHGRTHVLVNAGDNRTAWTGMVWWNRYNPSRMRDGSLAYIITDRPVYRPGQTVRYKMWLRNLRKGELDNAPTRDVQVLIRDPRGGKLLEISQQTDDYGGVDGQVVLGDEPPLGAYHVSVHLQGRHAGSYTFRVEEYKKPEFEVTVEPGKSHAKLGEKLTAAIKANYYFGAPVTDATVSYKVFRETYKHSYYFPGRWDWLYGQGYGLTWYPSPWFEWWPMASRCFAPPPWWYGYGKPVRELVMQGDAPIGEDGRLELEIDTAPALRDHGDQDHRYVIQADVRDASRRVISGEGDVKVTRQAYYTFVQPDRGYYKPGEVIQMRFRCLTPDFQPVKTEGVVTVSQVTYGGPDNAHIDEKQLYRQTHKTDDNGELVLKYRLERSAQLKFKFESPDKWGGVVQGFGLVWVCGREFDGKFYKFNDLELITDKRIYQPGETAHVMINVNHAGSHVLFSDDVDNQHMLSWKLLHIPGKSMVVDVPIERTSRPNFFVEATTVSNLRLHQQSRNILVPPEESVLDVTVASDKPEYRPGEKATVKVTARTLDGRPARAQLALSAFDKSVLYIQQETTQPIAKMFHGQTRHHSVQGTTNLLEQFSAWGYVNRPFQHFPNNQLPDSWRGLWWPDYKDWRVFGDDDVSEMLDRNEVGFALRVGGGRAGGRMAKTRSANGVVHAMEAVAQPAMAAQESQDGAAASPAPLAEAQVRTQFADTALWLAAVTTDDDGVATATFDMPENLTTWKINTWAMTRDTKVGQADTTAVTSKNLIVRLQAPRFFTQRDEVVISANVHNYLDSEKTAHVSLDVPPQLAKLIGDTPAQTKVTVPAGGETRVDWRIEVVKEGQATLTVKALTDEESDAMAMTFPVLVHGITKQIATTGSMPPEVLDKTATIEIDVPEQRKPELTRLEVRFAPSLVGAMLDALPYCLDYPYGCTEQTMSRFVPAALTLKTIRNLGIDLKQLETVRGRLDEVRRIEKGEHRSFYAHNPVFDDAKLADIIAKSLRRIADMQNGEGGWGWWRNNSSSPYMTSYALSALCTARDADVEVDENMIGRGMQYLKRYEEAELKEEHWSPSASRAFSAYTLSMNKINAEGLINRLWDERDKLNAYGKSLLAMALNNHGDDRAATVVRNILQWLKTNDETQVAWLETPGAGIRGWWYWWNSDIETNAWAIRAIAAVDPKSDVLPRMVKWLLNNRRNGYYWRSTRDTTLCVAAISDFVAASGEGDPDYTLTLDYDNGQVVKQVKINKENFFTFDNSFVLQGPTLTGGKHTLKITKQGKGALYFNTYLRYFTMEEPITAAGHELKVQRTYFKLEQIPFTVAVDGAQGQQLTEKRLRYKRVELNDGDEVNSGDLVQIELKVTSDNDYTYLAFEDPKPAGFEPIDLQSGGKGQEGFYSYMELRDEKVVFFVPTLGRGDHLLRYRQRAEVPGTFHALPSQLYGMYVPELRANSDERIIRIVE